MSSNIASSLWSTIPQVLTGLPRATSIAGGLSRAPSSESSSRSRLKNLSPSQIIAVNFLAIIVRFALVFSDGCAYPQRNAPNSPIAFAIKRKSNQVCRLSSGTPAIERLGGELRIDSLSLTRVLSLRSKETSVHAESQMAKSLKMCT